MFNFTLGNCAVGLYDYFGLDGYGDDTNKTLTLRPIRSYDWELTADMAGQTSGSYPTPYETNPNSQVVVSLDMQDNLTFNSAMESAGEIFFSGDDPDQTYLAFNFQALIAIKSWEETDGKRWVGLITSPDTNDNSCSFIFGSLAGDSRRFALSNLALQNSTVTGDSNEINRNWWMSSHGILERISRDSYRWLPFPSTNNYILPSYDSTSITKTRTTATTGSPIYKLQSLCRHRPDMAIAQDYSTGVLARCYFDGSQSEWAAGDSDILEVLPGNIGANQHVQINSFDYRGGRTVALVTSDDDIWTPAATQYYDSNSSGLVTMNSADSTAGERITEVVIAGDGVVYGSPGYLRKHGGWTVTDTVSTGNNYQKQFMLQSNKRWVGANRLGLTLDNATLSATQDLGILEDDLWDLIEDLPTTLWTVGEFLGTPGGSTYARIYNWTISHDGTVVKPMIAKAYDDPDWTNGGTTYDVAIRHHGIASKTYDYFDNVPSRVSGAIRPNPFGTDFISRLPMIQWDDHPVPDNIDY